MKKKRQHNHCQIDLCSVVCNSVTGNEQISIPWEKSGDAKYGLISYQDIIFTF